MVKGQHVSPLICGVFKTRIIGKKTLKHRGIYEYGARITLANKTLPDRRRSVHASFRVALDLLRAICPPTTLLGTGTWQRDSSTVIISRGRMKSSVCPRRGS